MGFRWVWWARKDDGRVVGGSVDIRCHKNSGNIWFERSYNGEKVGCHACTQNVKIEVELSNICRKKWRRNLYC